MYVNLLVTVFPGCNALSQNSKSVEMAQLLSLLIRMLVCLKFQWMSLLKGFLREPSVDL